MPVWLLFLLSFAAGSSIRLPVALQGGLSSDDDLIFNSFWGGLLGVCYIPADCNPPLWSDLLCSSRPG